MMYAVFHVAVYGFVLNAQGKLLIVRRSQIDSMPGFWELPGGSIEYGETLEDAVKREVLEETGLKVLVHESISIQKNISDNPKKEVIRVIYHCELAQEIGVTTSDEHDEFDWIDPKEISKSPLSSSLMQALEIWTRL